MLPALNTWLVVDLKEAKVLRAAGLQHPHQSKEAATSYLRLYAWGRGRVTKHVNLQQSALSINLLLRLLCKKGFSTAH